MGISADDEEDRRRYMPPWSRNSTILWVGENANGEPRYVDLSYTDPYSMFRDAVRALWRGDTAEAAGEAFEPFFAEDIVAGKMIDIWRNTTSDGREIWNPRDSFWNQFQAGARHLGDAFTPGTARSVYRILMAHNGTPTQSGRVYNLFDETTALSGQRVQSLDMPRSLGFHAGAFQRGQTDSTRLMTSVVRQGGMVSEQDLTAAWQNMERSRRLVFGELHRDVVAAQRQGMTPDQVREIIRGRGVSEVNTGLLLEGSYRAWWPGISFLNDDGHPERRMTVLRLALQNMGPLQRQEVEQELRRYLTAPMPRRYRGTNLQSWQQRVRQWQQRRDQARTLLSQ